MDAYKIKKLVDRLDKRGTGKNFYGRINDFINTNGDKNVGITEKHVESLIAAVNDVHTNSIAQLKELKKKAK